MTIKRQKVCNLCNSQFTTSQIKAKYCPECRPKAKKKSQTDRRLNLAQRRVISLPQADEWLWIARECRKAGTVEILKGVDIVALFALRKIRYQTYGWDAETNKSKFHLCHISPVKGMESVGLLHHLNLFIGNSLPNQKFSNKSHKDRGLCIPKSELKTKWRITAGASDRQVLDKVTNYLGTALIDYAKDHPVRKSQRFSLAKWVFQNDPANILAIEELNYLSMSELRKIKAKVEGKEVYKINYPAKRSVLVALEECQRLSDQLPDGQHKSDIAFMIPVLQVAAAWLSRTADGGGLSSLLGNPYGVNWKPLQLREGMDASKLRDFISFQAFEALQGAPVDRKLIRNTLRKYLTVTSLAPDYSGSSSSMQEYFANEYSQFVKQVPIVKNALISLGLPDKVMLAEELIKSEVAAREEAIYASFEYEQCADLYDYSTIHYEVEDDYTPNPNLKTFREEVFVAF